MRRLIVAMVIGAVIGSVHSAWAGNTKPAAVIGRKIENFKLRDFRGAEHTLAEFAKKDVVVVAFLGTECPLAKLYGGRLAQLAEEFRDRSVGFIAIDANEQDTLAEMAVYARGVKIEFPFLKDPANEVADQFGAERTPEVFVLDKERIVRYRGRVDDQYGIGFVRPKPLRRDAAVAVEELLSGKTVSVATMPATGCHIGRVNRQTPHGDVTYSKHVAPIIHKHCVVCHRAGEVAPFPLASYDDAANWSATIREVVQEGRMPPWHAAGERGKFVNDRRLSDAEKKSLLDWIDNGLREGDQADLPEPPKFTEGWQMAKPEMIVKMPKAFKVPATGTVEYQYFELPNTFDEDKWVVASEARPGNRAVVHHLILLYMPPGAKYRPAEAALRNLIAVYAPGYTAWHAPQGAARRIPAGSKLFFQVHYTPNGTAAEDASQAGLTFVDREEVREELVKAAVANGKFQIPPYTENVKVSASRNFPDEVQMMSLTPHMHLRGKSFSISLIRPNGNSELLLNVPRYDFNWQNGYVFQRPLTIPAGSKLQCDATYDNSAANPSNPDPSKTVRWGDQSWEEMMIGTYELVLAAQPGESRAKGAGPGVRRPPGKVSDLFRPMLKTKFGNLPIFPADNPWNQEIAELPVHPKSQQYLKSIGLDKPLHPDFGTVWNGAPNGIPFVVVAGDQKKVPVTFEYKDESDPGPYPIPADAPIEGGPKSDGDRHILVLDYHNKKLYETFSTFPQGAGWKAGSGAIFDLTSNKLRPAGWTSADAAGLPVFPGLVRYDEAIENGVIRHALRFTCKKTQRGYISPATHWASKSKDRNLPPMGLRVRLKANVDVSGFPKSMQPVLVALKKYGMFLADNGGDWFISGAPDSQWNDDQINTLKKIRGRDFEAVVTGDLVTE